MRTQYKIIALENRETWTLTFTSDQDVIQTHTIRLRPDTIQEIGRLGRLISSGYSDAISHNWALDVPIIFNEVADLINSYDPLLLPCLEPDPAFPYIKDFDPDIKTAVQSFLSLGLEMVENCMRNPSFDLEPVISQLSGPENRLKRHVVFGLLGFLQWGALQDRLEGCGYNATFEDPREPVFPASVRSLKFEGSMLCPRVFADIREDNIRVDHLSEIAKLTLSCVVNIPQNLINIFGLSVSEMDLIGSDLEGPDFSQADLSGVKKLNLAHAKNIPQSLIDQIGSSVSELNLGVCDLKGLDFSQVDLSEVTKLNLAHAKNIPQSLINKIGPSVSELDLTGCDLKGLDFSQVDLSGVNKLCLRRGISIPQNLIDQIGSSVSKLNLMDCDLKDLKFSKADLSGVKTLILDGAENVPQSLIDKIGSSVSGLYLGFCDLKGLVFTNVDLSGVKGLNMDLSDNVPDILRKLQNRLKQAPATT